MRFSRIFVPVAFITLTHGRQLNSRQERQVPNQVLTNSFIIEYAPGQSLERRAEDDITVVKTYESEIFRGASVWHNERILLEPTVDGGPADQGASVKYNPHNSTGVSKLHDQGIFGKGVIVGVVDTGVDYDHPALGGGFGPGFKVAKGYDFVGDGYGGKTPDNDPNDQQGHGSHVAGIVAGKNDYWSGVAPEATIYAYKVFDQAPGTDTATLIDAFLTAYADGVDIIQASIGGANGWSNNAWAEVASRLVEEGVVVIISAGNSGAIGPFYGSSGSSGKNVVAVASIETDLFPASPFAATFNSNGTSDTVKIGYLPATFYFPSTVKDWPIVALNLNTADPADGCTPYPAGTQRLDGKVALVRRGTCAFTVKQQNLAALGAKYILIYNTDTGALTTPSTTDTNSLIALIPAKSGVAIIEAIKAGGNVTADFSVNPEDLVALDYPAGGRPSIFTSWGALYDLQMKPDVAAPGGQIFSAWLDNAYRTISGTSMAAPYISGVAALYISVHGGRKTHGKGFGKFLHKQIISSGKAVPWGDGTARDYGFAAPVPQVGNGLIDAFKVVKYSTVLEFDKFALNDTAFHSRYHDISVTNGGKDIVTYTLSASAAAGVEAAGWLPQAGTSGEKRLKLFAELSPKKLEADVVLPRPFTLKPGESRTVSVTFRNPDVLGWNASALPVYSGKVIVSGTNGEQLSVPYQGLGANLKRELNPIFRNTWPASTSSIGAVDIKQKSSYTFNLSLASQDYPKIFSSLLWGTAELRWDIFEANWPERKWVYPPVVGQNGYVGSATYWAGSGQFTWFDPASYTPDQTFNFPITYLARNSPAATPTQSQYWWFGKLANGTQIANGNYTNRFAALKPFGNPKASDNWNIFQTPQIQVLGKY